MSHKEQATELKIELADYSKYGRVQVIKHWLIAQPYKVTFPYTLLWARGNSEIILAK